MVRELILPEDLVHPDAEPPVDDRGRGVAGIVRDEIVLEHLLDVPRLRGHHRPVSVHRMVAPRRSSRGGDDELRTLVDDRKADVDVVEEHVRRQVMTDILDHVMDSQPGLPHDGLDSSSEHELLAEDARLQRLSLGPERARVSIPALAVSHEARGPVRHATVQSEGLRLLGRVVVLRRRVLCHEQRVVDATRRQQPTTEGAKEAEAFGLVVPGPLDADRGRPCERDAA